MTKLTAWGVFKKVLALSLEILDHMIKAGAPNTKPGAMQLHARYEDGDIDIVKLHYELEELQKN